MMANAKKPGTDTAWESGELGENLESTRIVSGENERAVQESLGMQLISIRLPKSVIEDFKVIAQIEGIGYQPMMREALVRFAESESKRMMREYASKVAADKAKVAECASATVEPKPKAPKKQVAAPSMDEPTRKRA